jgi:polar amino acid transport system ATP-binding protein/sulfate transport system ATP-binding protein
MSPIPCEYRDIILKLEDVSVSYSGVPILRDVDLEIRNIVRPGVTQGQVVALLGPSGVGKTTLFRLLAGLMPPDRGRVLVTEDLVPVKPGMVGVVAQNYPLFMHRTVKGNLRVAGKQAGLSDGPLNTMADGLLKRFGLEGQGGKYPSQLSGGQRQRVALAQQFMCSKHFLLMDEPFSGLDVVAQEEVIAFIREMALSDELNTFVIVTHDISAALLVADLVWVLGRDRDAAGNVVPGARLQASYNLVERGLAWRDDIARLPEYLELRQEIRDIFPRL